MPHPDEQLTKKSYICVGIPKKAIVWNENEKIKIVFLICINKDNSTQKALKIWQYLSYLIKDQSQVNKILKDSTYESFMKSIINFYKNVDN
ncbi:PTS sugar transporter subunit IIA [Lactobacillus sp. ESL0791]|uniref:PTS sugar transporter subunit IIA n=1 Tax=Lactobacillus sp. ESL0791 TaxID=2983234 RepID=UPI0035AB9A85